MSSANTSFEEYIIDFDAPLPLPYPGLTFYEKDQPSNVVKGLWKWNPSEVGLWLLENQKSPPGIPYSELILQLEKKTLFNAHLVDFLLKNQHVIPESWIRNSHGNLHPSRMQCFGTIYRDSFLRYPLIRRMQWSNNTNDDEIVWSEDYVGTGSSYHSREPILILK